MDRDPFLSISEASEFLGVSEAALRQWTDERQLTAFITPGGHRRYSKAELKRFMTSHQKMLGIKDLASYLEASAPEHRQLDASSIKILSKANLQNEAQEQFAALGRQILSLVTKFVTEPAHERELRSAIREAGTTLGEMTASSGLSLIESIHIFTQHREPLMRAVAEMMKKGDGVQGRVFDAMPRVDTGLDEALLALVSAYQKNRSVE